MRVLISGAGVAGPTLAYWLLRYGHEPTIVEKAPKLRTGGYVIDFWGAGFDVAERMGLRDELFKTGYNVERVQIVGADGREVSGFPAEAFVQSSMGKYVSIARGDLAAMIFKALEGKAETIFGESVASIEERPNGIRVEFEGGEAPRLFDLVIGADGLHSKVRELVFGPSSRFEKYLGYRAAAFEACGYRPRTELTYVMYTQLGQQIGRFSMGDDRTMFLFTFAESSARELDDSERRQLLHEHFDGAGWECAQVLRELDKTGELYFDRVSQIVMPEGWSKGRVALIGDAATCVSLLAGQGSALAMIAAYLVAGELHASKGDYTKAFARYHQRFAPFVEEKQRMGRNFGKFFAPETKVQLFLRNQSMKLMRIGWLAKLFVGRDIVDKIELPSY